MTYSRFIHTGRSTSARKSSVKASRGLISAGLVAIQWTKITLEKRKRSHFKPAKTFLYQSTGSLNTTTATKLFDIRCRQLSHPAILTQIKAKTKWLVTSLHFYENPKK